MGISKKSAEKAVMETASSRIALAFPIFIFPGVINYAFDRLGVIPRNRVLRTI